MTLMGGECLDSHSRSTGTSAPVLKGSRIDTSVKRATPMPAIAASRMTSRWLLISQAFYSHRSTLPIVFVCPKVNDSAFLISKQQAIVVFQVHQRFWCAVCSPVFRRCANDGSRVYEMSLHHSRLLRPAVQHEHF